MIDRHDQRTRPTNMTNTKTYSCTICACSVDTLYISFLSCRIVSGLANSTISIFRQNTQRYSQDYVRMVQNNCVSQTEPNFSIQSDWVLQTYLSSPFLLRFQLTKIFTLRRCIPIGSKDVYIAPRRSIIRIHVRFKLETNLAFLWLRLFLVPRSH